jgi:hypothetical protein
MSVNQILLNVFFESLPFPKSGFLASQTRTPKLAVLLGLRNASGDSLSGEGSAEALRGDGSGDRQGNLKTKRGRCSMDDQEYQEKCWEDFPYEMDAIPEGRLDE